MTSILFLGRVSAEALRSPLSGKRSFAGHCRRLRIPVLIWVAILTVAATVSAQSNVELFASGLNNPRGLRFGPDGFLYVAEGGTGGTLSTAGECEQVIAPTGPYTGGYTARISKINREGVRYTVADKLPSSQTSANLGGLVSGVSDVEFVAGALYALLNGAGCSHGLAGTSNGVIKVSRNGKWKLIANLSAFQQAHPVANPEPDDFEPDGTWYSMTAVDNRLYALEPNHGELDEVSLNGRVHRLADISASQGHVVPTSITYRRGNFYVGNLGLFPIVPGSANVYRIGEDSGHVRLFSLGFTTALGITFDRRGRLYVLESMTAPGFPGPGEVGTGTIIRIDRWGALETIATGLSFPTAMTFGPDGNLYVSNFGFGVPPGAGQIMRVKVPRD
jgi:hypothetical protein